MSSLTIYDCEQGSPEWFKARLGIPTASEFDTVMAKGGGGGDSKTRRTYMLKLIGERMTGEPAENYSNAHMDRGRAKEAEARKAYAFISEVEPIAVGFIRNGDKGASPDSLIGEKGCLEVKTKLPHLHLEVLLAGVLPPEHKPQVQGQLWVAEREWCDFVSYWPKLPPFIVRVKRDEAYITELANGVAQFMDELQALQARITVGNMKEAA
jgi:hypothetical protein